MRYDIVAILSQYSEETTEWELEYLENTEVHQDEPLIFDGVEFYYASNRELKDREEIIDKDLAMELISEAIRIKRL